MEAPRKVVLVPNTGTTVTSRAAAASVGIDLAGMLGPGDGVSHEGACGGTKRLAVVVCDEAGYDFYLFRVSASMTTLLVDTDNGYGDVYGPGSVVIEGWGLMIVPFSAQLEPFVTGDLISWHSKLRLQNEWCKALSTGSSTPSRRLRAGPRKWPLRARRMCMPTSCARLGMTSKPSRPPSGGLGRGGE